MASSALGPLELQVKNFTGSFAVKSLVLKSRKIINKSVILVPYLQHIHRVFYYEIMQKS